MCVVSMERRMKQQQLGSCACKEAAVCVGRICLPRVQVLGGCIYRDGPDGPVTLVSCVDSNSYKKLEKVCLVAMALICLWLVLAHPSPTRRPTAVPPVWEYGASQFSHQIRNIYKMTLNVCPYVRSWHPVPLDLLT